MALKAGVTQASVSLALSNHYSIPAETRDRIQQIARELSYYPDPYLSGLCAYRKQNLSPTFQATIVWLSNWHRPSTSRWIGVNSGYFQGASARTQELGYKLEEIALRSPNMTPARMEQILLARNIHGIILPPQPEPGTKLDFHFDKFSVVTFGYTLVEPQLHTITLHHHRSMELLLRKLKALGYKRPGLALLTSEDSRTDRIWSAAFWSEQRHLSPRQRVALLTDEAMDQATIMRWYRRCRPDVVVTSHIEVYQWLTESGLDIPGDVGFALLTIPLSNTFYSGIWQNLPETGAKAVDFLVDMIHRDERGIPAIRSNLLIDGSWMDGQTVRRQE